MSVSNNGRVPFYLLFVFGAVVTLMIIAISAKINFTKSTQKHGDKVTKSENVFMEAIPASPTTDIEIDKRLRDLDKTSLEVDSSLNDTPITDL